MSTSVSSIIVSALLWDVSPHPYYCARLKKSRVQAISDYEEDATFLRNASGMSDCQAMAKSAEKLTQFAKDRWKLLLRSRDVTRHGALVRIFGGAPPNRVLCD